MLKPREICNIQGNSVLPVAMTSERGSEKGSHYLIRVTFQSHQTDFHSRLSLSECFAGKPEVVEESADKFMMIMMQSVHKVCEEEAQLSPDDAGSETAAERKIRTDMMWSRISDELTGYDEKMEVNGTLVDGTDLTELTAAGENSI